MRLNRILTSDEVQERRSDLMRRIEEDRVRLLAEMTDDERAYVKDMSVWQLSYAEYHQTLVDAVISSD